MSNRLNHRVLRAVLMILPITVVLSIVFAQSVEKSSRGASALVRWRPLIQNLTTGYDVYVDGTYPNPPLAGLLLYPLTQLSPVSSSMTWSLLKLGMVVASVFWCCRLVGIPIKQTQWAVALILCMCARPIIGDLQHGNINILVLFLLTAALFSFRHSMDCLTGLLIALATVVKVTPALFIVYFAYKRQWRVLGGCGLGLVMFTFILPSLVLGPVRNGELLRSWYTVMVRPYVVEGHVETTQVNQSLPGVAMRLLTDSPGIEMGDDVTVPANFASFQPAAVLLVVKAIGLLLLIWIGYLCRQLGRERSDWQWAAEFSLVCIAMLVLSERSWKHHYVVMLLPYAVVVRGLVEVRLAEARRGTVHGAPRMINRTSLSSTMVGWVLSFGLLGSFLLMLSTSSEVGGFFLDGMGHKLAQSWGLYFFSGILVFGLVSFLLMRSSAHAAASRSTESSELHHSIRMGTVSS